jgi:hypothetical protein
MHAGENVRRSGSKFFRQLLDMSGFTKVVEYFARFFAAVEYVVRRQRLVLMTALGEEISAKERLRRCIE